MNLNKLYLLPFIAWFAIYSVYFIFNHAGYPHWVVVIGLFIDVISELILLKSFGSLNFNKFWQWTLNLIIFVWYLYYLPVDTSGINGNLEWTIVFVLIDIAMVMLSYDNLIHLWHANSKQKYEWETIPRHFLAMWYSTGAILFLFRWMLYARK